MKYFYLDPNVGGEFGPNTVLESGDNGPVVHRLDFVFDYPPEDVMFTSFPCFIITEAGGRKLEEMSATGISLDEVEVSLSEDSDEEPDGGLPKFVWLKIDGKAESDDFGMGAENRLVVSERVLRVLKELGIPNAEVEPVAA